MRKNKKQEAETELLLFGDYFWYKVSFEIKIDKSKCLSYNTNSNHIYPEEICEIDTLGGTNYLGKLIEAFLNVEEDRQTEAEKNPLIYYKTQDIPIEFSLSNLNEETPFLNIDFFSKPLYKDEIQPELKKLPIMYAYLQKIEYKDEETKKIKETKFWIKKLLGYNSRNNSPNEKYDVEYLKRIDSNPKNKKFIIINDDGYDPELIENLFNELNKKHIINPEKSLNPKFDYFYCVHNFNNDFLFGGKHDDILSSDNFYLITYADKLRDLGLSVSKGLSWEKTAVEFVNILKDENQCNPKIKRLQELKNLIVLFDSEGVIYYSRDKITGLSFATIFYDPETIEGNTIRNSPGRVNGNLTFFIAKFLQSLHNSKNKSDFEKNKYHNICNAIREGLFFKKRYQKNGIECINVDKNENPVLIPVNLIKRIKIDISESNSENSPSPLVPYIRIPALPNHCPVDEEGWSIISYSGLYQNNLIAMDILKLGIEKAYLKYGVPYAKFNSFITFDKSEIEEFRSIKNMILEFIDGGKEKEIFAMSVFGSPGSGKSFGIKQLAEYITAEYENKKDSIEIAKLEYNLSQFNNPDDLDLAFHKIRNLVLEGKIPLVFFDEFDSELNTNKLGWLKYFLQPIQDGKFLAKNAIYPIGKSIFVFAGGTANSYEEFINGSKSLSSEEQKRYVNQFREAKGTDFVSRLKGYINIKGPNIIDQFDKYWMIRRAIRIRAVLERDYPLLFDDDKNLYIEDNLLCTLLRINEYRYGSRSIEAIIKMSVLSHKEKYTISDLPPKEQLSLHLDSSEFCTMLYDDKKEYKSDKYKAIAEELFEIKKKLKYNYPYTYGFVENFSSEKYQFNNVNEQFNDLPEAWNDLQVFEQEFFLSDTARAVKIFELLGFGLLNKGECNDPDDIGIVLGKKDFIQIFGNTKLLSKLAFLEQNIWQINSVNTGWVFGNHFSVIMKTRQDLIPLNHRFNTIKEKFELNGKTPPNLLKDHFLIFCSYYESIVKAGYNLIICNCSYNEKSVDTNEIVDNCIDIISKQYKDNISYFHKTLHKNEINNVKTIKAIFDDIYEDLKELNYEYCGFNPEHLEKKSSSKIIDKEFDDFIKNIIKIMPKHLAANNIHLVPFLNTVIPNEKYKPIPKDLPICELAELHHMLWLEYLNNKGWTYKDILGADRYSKETKLLVDYNQLDDKTRTKIEKTIEKILLSLYEHGKIMIFKLGPVIIDKKYISENFSENDYEKR